MKSEVPKKKLVVFLVSSTLLITFTFYLYQILYTPNILVDKEDKLFNIKSGSTFRDVQNQLYDKGFVNDPVSFSFVARLRGYDKEVTPGRFILRHNMNNLQAINTLKSGKQEVVRVTFSHVRLLKDLYEQITRNTGVTTEEFEDALDNFVESHSQEFTRDNILCVFIPNTYEVYYNILPEDLVERMYNEYKKFWNEERIANAKQIGLTPLDVSVLASIVQAETVKRDEAPIIAGLYMNRLKRDMALQADPTLVFAVGDFSLKRILNEHKEVDSPYNTYQHTGLPPGPINMPQIAMIDAVLHYQKHNYIYMCAREDFSGFHNFATNLNDHSRNARKYQQALTIEQRKAKAKNK